MADLGSICAAALPAVVQPNVRVAQRRERARLAVVAGARFVEQAADRVFHCFLGRVARELVPRPPAPGRRQSPTVVAPEDGGWQQREQELGPGHRWNSDPCGCGLCRLQAMCQPRFRSRSCSFARAFRQATRSSKHAPPAWVLGCEQPRVPSHACLCVMRRSREARTERVATTGDKFIGRLQNKVDAKQSVGMGGQVACRLCGAGAGGLKARDARSQMARPLLLVLLAAILIQDVTAGLSPERPRRASRSTGYILPQPGYHPPPAHLPTHPLAITDRPTH